MENREVKNKFWKGVLVGALVMAFAGLIIVGVSAGIFLIGRTVIDNQVQTDQVQSSRNENSSLDFQRINSKMRYIQDIIDELFLFEEDAQ